MPPWLQEAPLGARSLRECSTADGEEARVVGGAVRNTLIGAPPGDIDIATTALPPQVVRRRRGRRLQGGADRHRARHRSPSSPAGSRSR